MVAAMEVESIDMALDRIGRADQKKVHAKRFYCEGAV